MMAEAMAWVLESSVPNPAKAVLVALANWSDEDNSCSPSIERIAQVASIAPEQVVLELDHLQKSGMIAVRQHRSYRDGTLGVRYYLQLGVAYIPPAASEESHAPVDDGYTEFRRDVVRALVKHPFAFSVYALLVLDADRSGVAQISIRGMAEHGGVTEREVRSALEAILATPYAERLGRSSSDGDRVTVQLRPESDYLRPDLDSFGGGAS